MKILLLDIETSPILAHVWALWDQNVGLNQIVNSGEVLCWAAKWLGEPEIYFAPKTIGTKQMLKRIHKLLDQADAVVTYNSNRFDLPILNGEFLKIGLHPPAPAKSIDLLSIVKNKFRFPSNKLAYVAPALGVGEKRGNSGFELWVQCMAGNKDAWEEMKQYNIHDTVILEGLFNKLRPWIRGLVIPDSAGLVCRSCNSPHLIRRGFSYTGVGKYQRYQCQDCGAWMRGATNEIDTATRKELLRPL